MSISTTTQLSIIKKELDENGYYHYPNPISFDTFLTIASNLGNHHTLTDVKIINASKYKNQNPVAIELHNDHGLIKYIGWYCKEPHEKNIGTILVDVGDVMQHLSPFDIDQLSNTYIHVRDEKPCPILRKNNDQHRLYFMPWHFPENLTKDQINSLRNLITYLKSKPAFEVSLKKGECFSSMTHVCYTEENHYI